MTTMNKDLTGHLDFFFKPRSVAVVGASTNIFKWGSFLLVHMIHGKFAGNLYPVNPKESEILGLKVYKSVKDIPGPVDLALIIVPVKAVPGAIEDCIAKGVPAAVVITSGFSETGAQGRELEDKLMQRAREGGMRIIGPNTMGILSAAGNLSATGAPVFPHSGSVSMISQSGNLGTQMMAFAEDQGLGIQKFIGTGNEGDLDTCDLLDYLAQDPDTSVILLYMEGIDDGRRFLESARNASMRKPVIVLKAGRTDVGRKAAASHTGALGGSKDIFEAAFRQTGVIQAGSPSELIDLACSFANLPLPQGNNIGVITLGGGWGVVTADECAEKGLLLPDLPDDLIRQMDERLPSYWSRGNPIDLVGVVDLEFFTTGLRGLANSESFDAIITLGVVGTDLIVDRSARLGAKYSDMVDEQMADFISQDMANREFVFLSDVNRLIRKTGKPIVSVSLSGGSSRVHRISDSEKVVVFPTPEKAVLALAKLYEYSRFRSRAQQA